MARRARTATLLVCLALGTIAARPKREPEPAPPPSAEAAALPRIDGLFRDLVAGIDLGGVPLGLGTASAQGCNACHYQAHDDWAASAHAGPGNAAWAAMATTVGSPVCTACHLPLAIQRPDLTPDGGTLTPNPAFDATLHLEGVTCAACHVRQGRIVAARPDAPRPAAHAEMAWSPELRSADGCAGCHQLTWDGADKPLYDTWGEWSRSGYAEAGVACQACHLGGDGAHALHADPGRAITVQIAVPGVHLSRGGAPIAGEIQIANSGAGHAFPAGAPWREVEVRAALEHVEGAKVLTVGATALRLARTLGDAPPFATTEDTRILPGEVRSLPIALSLDPDAPGPPWELVVRVIERTRGAPEERTIAEKRLPLIVD